MKHYPALVLCLFGCTTQSEPVSSPQTSVLAVVSPPSASASATPTGPGPTVERRGGIASLDASDLSAPLVLRAAWVVTAAPTEISDVEAALTLIVLDEAGGRKTLEVGRWWRKQSTVLEPLEPNGYSDTMMFTTSAAFAVTDGSSEPTKGPVTIDILRASNGDILVATRGPQPELQARIHIPTGALRAKGLASAP